ncbi:MAG TPA: hypothetical protein DHW39_08400 [Erysipelotrichaceae bacterium]|nr:hypothetical protein [Erysipelotrichaceae bacterium]
MTEKEFKAKTEALKDSCRIYRKEKQTLLDMEKAGVNTGDFSKTQLYLFIKEDVEFVEQTLKQIEKVCGKNARLLIWLLFVEERTQAAVAQEFDITRRQLQYSVNKWLRMIWEEE